MRDQGRIRLLGFVIMPDHLHVAFALRAQIAARMPLPRKVRAGPLWERHSCRDLGGSDETLKSFTTHKLHQERLTLKHPIWQDGYHDHLLRDRRDFESRLAYMHDNPVRKGLVKSAEEYPFSTAHP